MFQYIFTKKVNAGTGTYKDGKEMHYTVKFFIIGGPVGVQVAVAVPSRAVAKMFENSDLIILSVEITRKK